MMALKTDIPVEKIHDLFCNDKGYQTPKVDTRGAIFQDGKILLVQEKNGKWALPGGWCDMDQSVASNTEKEIREEAGYIAHAERLIAVQDRSRHNQPEYAYSVFKIFVLCTADGGAFEQNIETIGMGFFGRDELPEPLAEEKTNKEQILMCFAANEDPDFKTQFD